MRGVDAKSAMRSCGDVERLDRADAEARDARLIENPARKIFKFDARGKIAAPGAEVDAAEDDFFVTGGGETAISEMTSAGGMLRLLPRTNGMDAIGAAEIAAVLNF